MRLFLVALSAPALALAVAVYFVHADARLWTANASWTLAGVVALVGVAAATRSAAPRDRRAWWLLLGATAAWLGGMCLWDLFAVIGFPPSPNPADLLWLAFPAVVTLSAGVAVAAPGEHPDAVLRRADEALYEAKRLGRNRIAIAADKRFERIS